METNGHQDVISGNGGGTLTTSQSMDSIHTVNDDEVSITKYFTFFNVFGSIYFDRNKFSAVLFSEMRPVCFLRIE